MSEVTFLDQGGDIAVLKKSRVIVSPQPGSVYETPTSGYDDGVHSPWRRSWDEGKKIVKDLKIAPWGETNLRPYYLLDLLSESNINARLIYTNVSFAVAQIYTFHWVCDPNTGAMYKKPFEPSPDIKRFLNSYKIRQLLRSRATDFFITGNCWVKFHLSRDGKQIADFQHIDASTVRLGLKDKTTKQIPFHYVCADWIKPKWNKKEKPDEDHNIRKFHAFHREDPGKYFISLHHSKLYWTGQPYYGIQPWHSGHRWIHYGNRMPVWMTANINKAHNIKYHVEYPRNYFDYLDKDFINPADRKKEKERVFKVVDDALSGAENAQSTFFTSFEIEPHTNKKLDGWSIKPLSNDLKDDAFVKSFFASNIASVSAMGVSPALAGIQMEGRMPASGSDKRISYQLHEVLNTNEAREIMVEPLEIWRDMNGFDPDMQFGFLARNIVTLAEDESGTKNPQKLPEDGNNDI